MSTLKVDLYESLQNKVSVTMLCRDIQTIYRREGLRFTAEFFKLFIRSIGISCEMDAFLVAQTIENGGIREFIRNNLTSNELLVEDQFFADDEEMLSSVNAFVQEFCEPHNPMIFDHKFLEALAICLNAIAQYGGNTQSDSVAAYYSLKFAHDLEHVRVSLADDSSNGSTPGLPPDFFKIHIFLFLENCDTSMVFERSAFDKIPKLLIDVVRSSNDIYVLERSQLMRLMNFTQFHHRNTKDIIVFFDELLKHGKDSVKSAMLDFLSHNTDHFLDFLDAPIVSVQIAAAKVILAAQRLIGNTDFLGPGKNALFYLKMISTNNNMRDVATKFFALTYKSANAANDHSEKTILQTLSNFCQNYRLCLENFSLIMNQVYKFFPLPLTIINEVCTSGQPISFKILDYYVKKLMEDDVDEGLRRDFVNVYMKKFPLIITATNDHPHLYEIVFDTLNKMRPDVCGTSSEIKLYLKVVTDFILTKIHKTEYAPTLIRINCVLKSLANVCDYTKDKIKEITKGWIHKFKVRDDFKALRYLCMSFFVHNVKEMLPEKNWQSVLKKTTTLLNDPEIHKNNPEIVYILMVHAELLSLKMCQENEQDDEAQVQIMKEFSNDHVLRYLQKPELLVEKAESMILLQTYSHIIMNLVLNYPEEGYGYFSETQRFMYEHAEIIVFGTPPTATELNFGDSYHALMLNGILNTVLMTLEKICVPEFSLSVRFGKFIFLLAKNMAYEEILERSIAVLLRNPDQASQIIGKTFFNFTFYPDEKTIRALKKLVDNVLDTLIGDENLKINICKGIVMHYIHDIGKYITLKEENKTTTDESTSSSTQQGESFNRLCVLKSIKDFLKNCSTDQKKDILNQQTECIVQGFLNSREKDSLKAFNQSISIDSF